MSSEQSKHEPVPPDEADTPPGERSNSVEAAPFPIVGIGASAGGLEAFTELLRHLPLDTGMADNRDSVEFLTMLLNLTGYETQTAQDGLQAMETATTFRPDVILLDIGLPKLNGYDVARKIREQPWGRDMILVALTGWGQEEDRRLSQEAGFNQHLTKPVDPDILRKLLARLPVGEGAG